MPLYTHIKGPVKYTVVGNPTIVDGVASGFSSGNYVKPASNVPFSRASSWEFVSRFQVEANTTGSHFLADFAAEAKGFDIAVTSTSLFWELGKAGASNWQYSKTISYTFDPTIFYSVKLSFDGNLYSIWLKTDTTQWTKLDEYASTTGVGTSYYNAFGYSIRFGGRVLNGSIDLNSTYIKVNGQPWFGLCPTRVKLHLGSQTVKPHILQGDYGFDGDKLVWANPNLYLKNNSSSYIDTLYYQTNNTGVEIKFSADSDVYKKGFQQLFGGNVLTLEHRVFLDEISLEENKFNVAGRYGNNKLVRQAGGCYSFDKSYIVKYDKNKLYVDGSLLGQATELDFIDTTKTSLFKTTGGAGTFLYGKIYFCKFYENDELKRHFVPVPAGLKIGDYTVPANGMWDIVTQQFFGNSGTGEFAFGKDN